MGAIKLPTTPPRMQLHAPHQPGATVVLCRFLLLSVFFCLSLSQSVVVAQVTSQLRWRLVGPFRGGRTVAAVGIPSQPNTFYIGINNGGVWKTTDAGRVWTPIFDDQPTGSVGAIAIAPSNPNVIYVGSGE